MSLLLLHPSRRVLLVLLAVAGCAIITTSTVACKTQTPTHAVVENAFPLSPDPPHATIVYRVWWRPTYFPDFVMPGESSVEERTVPATDFAYALVAPGWDPTSGAPPTYLIPLKSKAPLTAKRGETLHISMSNDTFTGSCDTEPLSQDDADLITQRIFSSDFAGYKYDAKTCALIPILDGSEPGDDAGTSEPPISDAAVDGDADVDGGDGGDR